MQFKTLAVAAVAAIATVSAYDSNACTTCVYASIPKDSVCATLNATALGDLTSVFGNTTFDLTKLSGLVQDASIRSCVCHWATTAFTPTGSAAGCATGTGAVCNNTQIGQASQGISVVVPTLGCNAANVTASGGAASPSGSAPATSSPSNKPAGGNAAVSINVPYVVSIAAIGLAALAGL